MFVEKTGIRPILKAIDDIHPQETGMVLIFLAQEKHPALKALVRELNRRNVRFMGGVFPAVIHDGRVYRSGAVVMSLPVVGRPHRTTGLDRTTEAMKDLQNCVDWEAARRYTAFILVDGWTTHIADYTAEIFRRLGNAVGYIGGGAGTEEPGRTECLFSNEGPVADAAFCAIVPLESSLGVRHGWRRFKGPLVATRTRGNVICELNWRRAFTVYREAVEADCGCHLTTADFYSVSSRYPFGIYKEGAEYVVRDPISVNSAGEIRCVGEIPENTVLSIMKGEKESLISAARDAAEECCASSRGTPRGCLVVDCVSRSLFLQEDYEREMDSVAKRLKDLCGCATTEGFLSIGEISSYGEGFLEYFNKTVVVAALLEE